MGQVRVLVVDDSLTIRAMMRQVLESDPDIRIAGEAASADEADDLLEGCVANVITLDIEMPGKSGLEYLEELRAKTRIPVIMLSSYTVRGEETRAKALLAGAVGCFNKANAVREKDRLIKLVKEAARKHAKLDREDKAAMQALKQAATEDAVPQLAD